MIETFLGLIVGFALGKMLTSPAKIPDPDKILKWDSKIMGYRPVLNIKDMAACEEILFAFVFKKNQEKQE